MIKGESKESQKDGFQSNIIIVNEQTARNHKSQTFLSQLSTFNENLSGADIEGIQGEYGLQLAYPQHMYIHSTGISTTRGTETVNQYIEY